MQEITRPYRIEQRDNLFHVEQIRGKNHDTGDWKATFIAAFATEADAEYLVRRLIDENNEKKLETKRKPKCKSTVDWDI